MKLSEFIRILQSGLHDVDPNVEFVGIKWQDQLHPSAELFPIELVDAKANVQHKITVKFVTTKHNQ